MTGSGKTERLVKIVTYYISKYSEKGVLIVLPNLNKSDIVSRTRRNIGYKINVNVKSARTLKYEDLLEYEVIIFDDVDVALLDIDTSAYNCYL